MNKNFKIKSGKFKLKKNPKLGNTSQLTKVNSVVENQFSDSMKSTDKMDRIKQDGFIFHSKNAKNITKNYCHNFNTELMQAQFDEQNSNIIASFIDGSIYFYNNKLNNKSFYQTICENIPITSLKWKDQTNFYLGNTESDLYEYKYISDKNKIEQVQKIHDQNNEQIFTIDHSQILQQIIYAGKNMQITLLDQETKKTIKIWEKGDSYQQGHTNRIFQLKFLNNEPQLFLSGGWDCTMFLWDVRTNKPVKSVFGPCVSGESIDIENNLILAGSYRDKDPLELYDLRTFKKLCNINERTTMGESVNYISSCQFSKNKKKSYIIAGSCLSNLVSIFKKDLIYQQDVVITGMSSSVFSCGFSKNENKFFFGTSEGKIGIYNYLNM